MKPEPTVFGRDSLHQIELEARRMRAQTIAEAGAAFRRGLARLFSRQRAEPARAVRG